MNPFDPANLSPKPKTPVLCPLPYELTWEDIWKVLPDRDEHRSHEIQAYSSYEKQGLNGGSNSSILSIRYPNREHQFLSSTIFIKHTTEPDKMEAQRYRALAALGIPTPRLLATIDKNGAEILLLEFLPKIGIDFHSAHEVNELLQLTAQLNAIQNPPEVFRQVREGIPQAEFDERVRRALREVEQDASFAFKINVRRWFEAYQFAQAACKSMPLAVSHNEFSFQQVGWTPRGERDQLVIFDLETMWLSPRFTDIAGILPRLARYTGQNHSELFKTYLDKLSKRIPLKLNLEGALQELRLVQIKAAFDSLPWHVDIARRSGLNQILDRPLAINVHNLYDNLFALGFL